MFSAGLVLAFAGMCLSQQQQQPQQVTGASPTQYQQQTAVSQASFQTGPAAVQPVTKLEDIEHDSLLAAFGQKTVSQQQPGKPTATPATPAVPQQQQQQIYQTAPQQQYYVQPYQAQQQQFYVQPFQAQPYQMAFDYAGVQYMIINPNAYNPANQMFQQYYMPAVPTPSAVPQYVTKQSFPAAASAPAAQTQQVDYKQQQFSATATAAPAQQEYKQQQFAAPPAQAQQEYKYVVPASAPTYQYVQQPSAAAAAASPADFSYVTRHPAAPSAQFKAPAVSAQPQYVQYTAPQPQYQQQPQFYYPAPTAQQAAEQQVPHVQQSVKSQFSSGVKSTTPTPYKEPFAYKFESSQVQQSQQKPQQQQPGAAYSTLRYSA